MPAGLAFIFGNTADFCPLRAGLRLQVTRRTASLVAAWQCVGWCHGVLNTDNMSLVGVTIDYGPFGEARVLRGADGGVCIRGGATGCSTPTT